MNNGNIQENIIHGLLANNPNMSMLFNMMNNDNNNKNINKNQEKDTQKIIYNLSKK